MSLPKLPENSASIIIGLPLSGKKQLLYNFMIEGLKNKEPVLFISTDKAPEEIKIDLVKNKIFYAQYKTDLKFIDCYSHHTGNFIANAENIKRISGPLALNEISIALSEIEKEFYKKSKHHLIIFNSLSTMLLYLNPQTVARFLQVIIAKIKKAEGSVIFTLEEGMHEQKDMITIEHLMDAIIYVKHEKTKTMIRADGIKEYEEWKELK